MPHLAAAAINAWISEQPAGTRVVDHRLPDNKVRIILPELRSDALGLFYSSQITMIDAFRGISHGYMTWAIVKLYYSAFFAVRSLLAANSIAIFFAGKEHSLELIAGAKPRTAARSTHKTIWHVLKERFPNISLLGEIEGKSAPDWMTELREQVNYKTPKFPDPLVPKWLAAADSIGLSKAIHAYVSDSQLLYTFDADHAAIAYPMECLRRAKLAIANAGLVLDQDDTEYLHQYLQDSGVTSSLFEGL